jgi:hypothetical protein
MKRFFVAILVAITMYVGTYIWLRASHVERWDHDGHDYVLLPSRALSIMFIGLLHILTRNLPACVFTLVHTASDYHPSI